MHKYNDYFIPTLSTQTSISTSLIISFFFSVIADYIFKYSIYNKK